MENYGITRVKKEVRVSGLICVLFGILLLDLSPLGGVQSVTASHTTHIHLWTPTLSDTSSTKPINPKEKPVGDAEEGAGNPVQQLEDLLVTATYLPGLMSRSALAVRLIRRDDADLRWRPAATLDEIAAQLPGVQIRNRENYALGERVTIRGLGWRSPFGVRGIRVLLDQIPLTVGDGQTIVTMADPAMVQRVEVIQGPSSSFYGNAAGGVIAMYTSPAYAQTYLRARVMSSSYADRKAEVSWGFQLPKDWQLDGFVTHLNTDGYRDHSAATITRAHIGAAWRPQPDESLEFHVHHTSMPFAEHPGALTREMLEEDPAQARSLFSSSGAGKEFHQTMTGVQYEKPFPGGRLQTGVHALVRDLENPLPFGTILVQRYAGGGRLGWTFTGLPFELQTGAELLLQSDDRQNRSPERFPPVTVTLDQAESVVNQALFAQTRIPLRWVERLGRRLNVNLGADFDAGIRADRVLYRADPADPNNPGAPEDPNDPSNRTLFDDDQRDFFSLNPSVGVIFRLGRHQIFSHLSSSFETPTTTELVNQPDGTGGFNREVGPEKTLGLESGVRLFSGERSATTIIESWSLSLTVYRMRVTNLLVPFELDEGGREYFRNEGASDHTGLELTSTIRLVSDTDLRVGLHWSEALFSGGTFDGNGLPGIPGVESSLQVRHQNRAGTWVLEGFLQGKMAADSENNHWADSVFRLQTAWTSAPIRIANRSLFVFVSIDNVLNESYVSSVNIDAFGGYFYEPGRPRHISGGISLDL